MISTVPCRTRLLENLYHQKGIVAPRPNAHVPVIDIGTYDLQMAKVTLRKVGKSYTRAIANYQPMTVSSTNGPNPLGPNGRFTRRDGGNDRKTIGPKVAPVTPLNWHGNRGDFCISSSLATILL